MILMIIAIRKEKMEKSVDGGQNENWMGTRAEEVFKE